MRYKKGDWVVNKKDRTDLGIIINVLDCGYQAKWPNDGIELNTCDIDVMHEDYKKFNAINTKLGKILYK